MFSKGKVLVLKSSNGVKWVKHSETMETEDIRDPRFMVYDKTLYLLVNFLRIKEGRVVSSMLLKGVVREGFTGIYPTGDANCFITSIAGTLGFSYNPCSNGENKIIGLQKNIRLPSYEDSTEGSFIVKNNSDIFCFVRNDTGKSYWLVRTPKYIQIMLTDYIIHSPLLIENGKYLLGREMKESENKFDIRENTKSAELWLYEVKGFSLKKKRRIQGFGDCGYFGYAKGMISFHSSYNEQEPHLTAIFMERL